MKRRICLSGASGTGKTTVLNAFEKMGVPVIKEVARSLKKEQGITLNELGTDDTQNLIFNEYKRRLETTDIYMSDRWLGDVLAYTTAGVELGQVSQDVLVYQEHTVHEFVVANPDIIYIYFPIEFPVEDDGVRSTSEEYRAKTDVLMHDVLDAEGVQYLTVHGTPEERIQQIIDYVGPDFIDEMTW